MAIFLRLVVLSSVFAAGCCVSFELPLDLARPEIHSHVGFNRRDFLLEGSDAGQAKNAYHLPDTITPLAYDLKIVPNIAVGDFTFTGVATITLSPKSDTDSIVMNSLGLKFTESNISIAAAADQPLGEDMAVSSLTFDNTTEQVTIKTSLILKAGLRYNVTITYSGELWSKMLGLYRSWYNKDNATRWLATTQFESTYARSAFPSFDEPRFRTNFTVAIARDPTMKAISNMPVVATLPPDPSVGGKVWDVFETTPEMATYLLAFCVFDFEKVTDGKVSVWAAPGFEPEAEYIAHETPTILEVLGNFTAIEYQLPKLDLVAVPDFNAGAMENWGITTYREKYLLFKNNTSTQLDKQWILATVAHELAHQWFGDLVTPSWWDYTWLNEAFATYFEYYVPDQMDPSWRMMEQFVIRELQPALASDEGFGHPITANVSTPSEIDSIFDVFSYNKGGSVLRMLQHFVGETNYRNSIQHYLKHGVSDSLGTVTPDILWASFNATLPNGTLPTGVSIQEIMTTWIDQKGFPLITVSQVNNSVFVSQTPYVRESLKNESTIDGQQWWVPLTYTTNVDLEFNSTLPKAWLAPNGTYEIDLINDLGSADWILFNIQQTGYYRVNYDLSIWGKLIDQLMEDCEVIHPLNRAQLLDDAFNLAVAGKVNFTLPLDLAGYLVYESDYIPWFVAINHFSTLIRRYHGTDTGTVLRNNFKDLISNAYIYASQIDQQSRNYSTTLLTTAIYSQACNVHLDQCEQEQLQKFKEWIAAEDKEVASASIDPDIKYTVICTGLRLGDHNDWTTVWNHYANSNVTTEKALLLQALGCTVNTTSIQEYLSKLTGVQPGDIRSQDYVSVFRAMVYNPESVSSVVDYMTKNYKHLLTILSDQLVKTFFSYFGSSVTKESDRKKLEEFAQTEADLGQGLAKVINSTLKSIDRNLKWKEEHSSIFVDYYNTNSTNMTTQTPPHTDHTPQTPLTEGTTQTPLTDSTAHTTSATTNSSEAPHGTSTGKPGSDSWQNKPSTYVVLCVAAVTYRFY